mmetsp:Transcript_4707/g.12563  ORF Transcript_4707/g.12563 Transcript_4707/m.12563 type:complete len:260 (-) Transcript_4707:4062-4841(-)
MCDAMHRSQGLRCRPHATVHGPVDTLVARHTGGLAREEDGRSRVDPVLGVGLRVSRGELLNVLEAAPRPIVAVGPQREDVRVPLSHLDVDQQRPQRRDGQPGVVGCHCAEDLEGLGDRLLSVDVEVTEEMTYQCISRLGGVECVEVHELHGLVRGVEELGGLIPETLLEPHYHLVVSPAAHMLKRLPLGLAEWGVEDDTRTGCVAGVQHAHGHRDDRLECTIHLPCLGRHLHVLGPLDNAHMVDDSVEDDVVLKVGRLD